MIKVNSSNSLGFKFPDIASEWHPVLNGYIRPNDVVAKSHKKYWFICSKGHSWEAALDKRTLNGTNCPYCKGKKVCYENSLANLFPKVSSEWDKDKNTPITPKDVPPFSNKKYWFKCERGHSYSESISVRTKKNTGCPYCSNHKVCVENCLKTLFPEIAEEWHPTKNKDVTPNDVVAGSSKKYWFKCHSGHEWEARLSSRTFSGKNGCPYCFVWKTQEEVRTIFERIFNKKFKKMRPKFLKGLEFDGANEELKIAWEYDGEFHEIPHFGHKDPISYLKKVKERDLKKDFLSQNAGWTLIRIHYSNKDNLEKTILEKLENLNIINSTEVCFV